MPTFMARRHVETDQCQTLTIGPTTTGQAGVQVGDGPIVELSPVAVAEAVRHLTGSVFAGAGSASAGVRVGGMDSERHWRTVALGVDDPCFEAIAELPEPLSNFSESRAGEADDLLRELNQQICEVFWEVESAERACRESEEHSLRMADVRQHLRRVLAGWESHVLGGFDRASMALRTPTARSGGGPR